MELKVRFKEGVNPAEYEVLHPALKKPLELIAVCLDHLGYDTMITSMLRKANTIPGESNVHATGRALDCVPVARDGKRVNASKSDMQRIAAQVNSSYRRRDQKLTCLFHNTGLGNHFHVQVPWSKDYKDLHGVMPH